LWNMLLVLRVRSSWSKRGVFSFFYADYFTHRGTKQFTKKVGLLGWRRQRADPADVTS
jgi:hypothetical protein